MLTHLKLLITYLEARFDVREERGATAVEYALLVALMAAAIVAAVAILGPAISDSFSNTADRIKANPGSGG